MPVRRMLEFVCISGCILCIDEVGLYVDILEKLSGVFLDSTKPRLLPTVPGHFLS